MAGLGLESTRRERRTLRALVSERWGDGSVGGRRWGPRSIIHVGGRRRQRERRGLAVWHGNDYALEVMKRLGLEDGAVRVGIVHYNTAGEVERLLDVFGEL